MTKTDVEHFYEDFTKIGTETTRTGGGFGLHGPNTHRHPRRQCDDICAAQLGQVREIEKIAEVAEVAQVDEIKKIDEIAQVDEVA
jgi:hypothetical protein